MIYGNYLRDKYASTALKIADAEGVPCVMEYSKGKNLRNYEIYGNSVQDGTPSPESPVEIQSVGDLVTDTESEYYGKYDIPITVTGKNLLKYPYASESLTRNGLTYTINSDASITISGTATANSYIVLMRNCDFGETSITEGSTNGIYSTSKKLRYNAVNKTVSINFKLGNTVDEIFYPQIEYGTVSTAYEPYKGSITEHIYLNEPLRKVGDYADYIDFKNQKVVRNIIKQSLRVNSIYKKLNSVIRIDGWISGAIKHKLDSHILSTIFNYNLGWSANIESIFHHPNNQYALYWSVYWSRLGLTYDGTNVYRTDDTSQTPLTDSEIKNIANEWLSTLSDKDKEIYVILDTPTEEPISLPTLKTVKGTSVILVDTSVEPSNIKAKYIKL